MTDGDIAAWDEHWQGCRGGNKLLTTSGVHRQYFNELRAAIKKRRGSLEGIETLELGCGRGTVSQLLSQNGACVSLLDTSAAALDIAKSNFRKAYTGYHRAYLCDARRIELPSKCVDVVFSVGLLEHFEDPGGVLSESLRLAKEFAWHVVIGKTSGNDKWFRSELPMSWYEEQGWIVTQAESPHIFTIVKDTRCTSCASS